MQKKQKTSLVWFRNDLRVNDQASLYQAAKESEQVIALYCFDPRHFAETQFGLKNEGEKFIPFQMISLTIRFILSVIFIGFFAYIHTPDMVLFVSNFFVLYLCSTNFEIFGLLRNLRRF